MGLAGSGGAEEGARWRVFVSYTSELRDFPRGMSYLTAVEHAISAAGHVIVDMTGFPSSDQAPAQVCADMVRGCDVYVGVLGTRYGSPVRDRREASYTELEFDTATEAGLDRLVFLLDTDAEEVGIPPSALIDREFGVRQDAFRRRVQDGGLTTRSFASPAELQLLVERSLRDLAATRIRLVSGIQRERVPAEPQPVRATKFVNPPPAAVPAWYAGRQVETRLLAKYVADPGIAMVTVSGRPGIGKTALVCRLLKGLEAGGIPDAEPGSAAVTVGGIVYLSRNGLHQVDYPTLVADLLRLLPVEEAERLRRAYQDPRRTPGEVMLTVLEAFPAGEPVVVLLDNLESVMDAEREILTDEALREALCAVLTAPAHAITVIVTTRVIPADLVKVEPGRQHVLRLDEGLGSPDAQNVLRELDDDGRLGLRDAAEELLDGLRQHTRGFPRALEAVKAILVGDAPLTPQDLLDRTRRLSEDRVVQVLVGEAYDLLDESAQRVMQALAVYPGPVSAVGADFLLQPSDPTTDAAPILTRLVRRQLVQYQDSYYSLHPVDREYARGQLPAGGPRDSPSSFTLTGLQARAADYYAQIRTPRESWRTLEDVRPQMAEFELRCDTSDYDSAAAVLTGIDTDYLWAWGHYRTLVGLHGRVHGRIIDPSLNRNHLNGLGLCLNSLGEYWQAIDLHTQALASARNAGARGAESNALGHLGNCHARLGNFQQAIDLDTQALSISRNVRDRQSQGTHLGNLGVCHFHLGEYRQAMELLTDTLLIFRDVGDHEAEGRSLSNVALCHMNLGEYRQAIDLLIRALAIAQESGHRQGECIRLANLGLCHFSLGEYGQAIDAHSRALAIARDIGYRYGEALALEHLGRARLMAGDASQAVTLLDQAVDIADATGDTEPAAEAWSWLARGQLQLSNPTAAATAAAAGQQLHYPPEEPMLRLLEGLALLTLGRHPESVQAFNGAVTVADALLTLADRNVAALQVRALALSGLVVTTGDQAKAAEAAEAFARLRTVTAAAGVAADTRSLLDRITRHDRGSMLAGIWVEPGESPRDRSG